MRMTLTALPMTSAGRFSPLGPVGIFDQQLDTWPRIITVSGQRDMSDPLDPGSHASLPVRENHNLFAYMGNNFELGVYAATIVPNFTPHHRASSVICVKHTTGQGRSASDCQSP